MQKYQNDLVKNLNLTILFVDNTPARIYLALLKKHRYKPKNIVFLDMEPKSEKYMLAKRIIGETFARKLARNAKIILAMAAKKSEISKAFAENLISKFDLSLKDIGSCDEIFPEVNVEKISISGLDDPSLIRYIEKSTNNTFLFTGGGLLREGLLSIHDKKFIHIHPGIVPEVKGADCFFWSYLLRGKAGYSVFYMNTGIDTGDMIHTQEFDLDLKVTELNFEDDLVYRAILQFYDPCLRMSAFIQLLKNLESGDNQKLEAFDMGKIGFVKQDPNAGRTYFFMHDVLKSYVINKLRAMG